MPPSSPPACTDAWIRFARTGNPGWDQYDTTRRATMRIDSEWTQVDDPRGREGEAWS